MATLQRNKEYILGLIGEPEETETVNRRAIIESKFGSDASGTSEGRRDIALQTAALLGVDLATSIFDEATRKSSQQRRAEIENSVIEGLQSRPKNASKVITSQTPIEQMKFKVSENSLNFLNRWVVEYGDNQSLSNNGSERKLLKDLISAYTIEVSLPTIEISTSKNSLSYISNEDVSNLQYTDFTVTVMLDGNMKIYDAVYNIINKIRNPETGRYGYKDDYKFNFITVYIYNELGEIPLSVGFTECVLKGISETTLTYAQSEIKTISLTFSYDRMSKRRIDE